MYRKSKKKTQEPILEPGERKNQEIWSNINENDKKNEEKRKWCWDKINKNKGWTHNLVIKPKTKVNQNVFIK